MKRSQFKGQVSSGLVLLFILLTVYDYKHDWGLINNCEIAFQIHES